MLAELERDELLVRGELRPGGTEREWCDPDVLRRLRRASLAALRREVEPVEREALARFLPSWHGIDRRASLREALVPLQALALPVALWEARGAAAARARLPARAPRRALRERRGRLGRRRARPRRALLPRGRGRARPGRRRAPRPEGDEHDADPRGARARRALLARPARRDRARRRRGAARAVGSRLGGRGDERRVDAAARRRAASASPKAERRPRRFSRRRAQGVDRDAGPLVAHRAALRRSEPERRALAELLLERQGIVTRDGVRAEGIPGGYGAVYAELRALETLGLCRRGYFVEGLGGAQFALGGAVERLRELRERDEDARRRSCSPRPIPAQPYGAALPWPKRAGARAARVAGAYVVLARRRGGALRRARRPLARPAARPRRGVAAAGARARSSRTSARGGAKRLAVERFDGEPVAESDAMPLLVEAGFLAGPRRAVLRPRLSRSRECGRASAPSLRTSSAAGSSSASG